MKQEKINGALHNTRNQDTPPRHSDDTKNQAGLEDRPEGIEESENSCSAIGSTN